MRKLKDLIIEKLWLIHILIGVTVFGSAVLFGVMFLGQTELGLIIMLAGALMHLLTGDH